LINGGGSYLKLSADGIEQGTTGDWTSYAAKHSMEGGKNKEYAMPNVEHFKQPNYLRFHFCDRDKVPHAHKKYLLVRKDGTTEEGVTNAEGFSKTYETEDIESLSVHLLQ